jgi:hypothetical protein
MSFKDFYSVFVEESTKPDVVTRFVVEAFDAAKADAKGIQYRETEVAGVKVVITGKRGIEFGHDSTVIINQSDLIDASSSFCQYNPQINQFAKESPENLFYVMGLVVGTIGSSWVQFRNLYPVYAAYVKQTDGRDFPVEYIVGLDGKKVKVARWFMKGAPRYMKRIWAQREFLYKKIYEDDLISDEYELYKFIIKHVDGMATVKAAFAVQLLTGKLGCIDNINSDIYGAPVTITNATGQQIDAPAFKTVKGEKTDELSPKGKRVINDYIDFVKAIGKAANSPYSQRLWDDWTQLAAAKSVFSDSHKQIQFNLVDGRTAIMPTYTNDKNSAEYTEFLKNARKSGVDPFGGVEIGKDHFTVPKMAGEIDDASDRVS